MQVVGIREGIVATAYENANGQIAPLTWIPRPRKRLCIRRRLLRQRSDLGCDGDDI